MPRIIFIFLATFFMLLAIYSGGGQWSNEIEVISCMSLIIILGIPHGAIDHILYLSKREKPAFTFYFQYLSLIGLNVLFWIWLPQLAFFSFLFVSAYHFGQSQFNHLFKVEEIPEKILYFIWGLTLMLGLIFFNIDQILALEGIAFLFSQNFLLSSSIFLKTTLIGCFAITLGLMMVFTIMKKFKWETFLLESLVLILILSAFYLLPLLVGFTLYFVVLHSMKVMEEEYVYLRKKQLADSFSSFIKMLLPYTVLSFVGIILLIIGIQLDFIAIPLGYMFLILVSSITLPHIFVMELFYK